MTKKSRHIISFLLILTLFPGRILAQKYLREGDRYFDRNLFEEAIPFYLKEIKKGHYRYRNEAREKLASCYRLTGRFLEAAEEYKQILDRSSKLNKPENYLNYANSLKNGAKYAEAAEQFKKYIKVAPNDPMGEVYLKSCYMAQKWLDEMPEYEVANVDVINSTEPDFAPVFFDNGIIFTSSRKGSTKKFINFSENIGVVNTDLYYVDIHNLDGEEPVKKIQGLDSFMHDGDATFSADGSEVYFTRTIMGDKNRRSNTVLSSLQVFYSKRDSSGHWSEPVSAFDFNSDEYSVGQPNLSRDGKTIFYISDMPGGKGETDIYYSSKRSDGEWGDPVNLGDSVNTFGHELFPSVAGGDTLYFSSDTHPGMGKLDIFRAVKKEGVWQDVTNMKPPINSIGDDFGITFTKDQTMGFFSSDRFNGKGKDDIYSLHKESPQELFFAGHKIQIPDYSLFNGVTYKISKNSSKDQVALVSRNGMYEYPLEEDSLYTLVLRKNGFYFDKITFSLNSDKESDIVTVDFHSGNNGLLVGGFAVKSAGKNQGDTSRIDGGPGSKEPLIHSVKESFLPATAVELYRDKTRLNNVVTNDRGFYLFPDTLDARKDYKIIAVNSYEEVKEDNPGPVAEQPVKSEPVKSPETEKLTTVEPEAEDIDTETKPVTIPVEILANDELKEDETAEIEIQDVTKVEINSDEVVKKNEASGVEMTAESTFTSSQASHDLNTVESPSLAETVIRGTIRNAGNGNPLSDCDIIVYEGIDAKYLSDTGLDGDFNLKVRPGQPIKIVVSRTGFFQAEKELKPDQLQNDKTALNIFLEPIKMNKTVRLNNILFDYNKATLRAESRTELDKLTRFLKVNPDVVIELDGHTDARGSYYSNLLLSGRRVASARSYLIANGINGDRIIAHGYGESFPIIRNAKTEKDHELNRRIEFTVIDKDKLSDAQYEGGQGMYILSACPYSDAVAFPRNPRMPDSAFYRISLGQYSQPAPRDKFKGLFPVVEEYDEHSGLYSYYAGFFKSLDDAGKAGNAIQEYSGLTVSVESPDTRKSGEQNHFVAASERQAEGGASVSKKETFSTRGNPVFSIQIGAFRRPVRSSYIRQMNSLAGRYKLNTDKWNGLTIYSIGRFQSYREAFEIKQDLEGAPFIDGAFIVAWINGRKISVTEANAIITDSGNDRFITSER